MKKVLALFLAVLMIASMCSTIAFAEATEPQIDMTKVLKNNNAYLGKPVETAPELDGVIDDGEYTFSRAIKPIDYTKSYPETEEDYKVEIVEYMAYDADFIYYAYTMNPGYVNTHYFYFRLAPDYIVGSTLPTFGQHSFVIDPMAVCMPYTPAGIETGSSKYQIPEGKDAPTNEDFQVKFVKDTNNEKPGLTVCELKLSRAYIAEQTGLESAADVTMLAYSGFLNWIYYNALESGSWGYVTTDHTLTDEDVEALKAAGITTEMGLDLETLNNNSVATKAFRVYSVMILGEKPAEEEEPEDLGKWGNLAEELGMNVHVDAAAKSPVLDGVISEGEYTAILHNDKEDIKNYGTNIKDDNGLTEYYAHDADYIYYAVSYANPNGGVAFQWQFKPFNSFDIYNPSGADDYYHNRLSGQARYNEAYANKYRYWNTDYTGSWAHVFTHTTSVRAPYMHKTMVAGSYEEYHCAGGINNGISVFEAKIAKAYIAEINNCEIADVKVVPYFTFLHSADNIGVLMNAQQVEALKAAGAEFTPAAGDIAYRFIVLDGTSEAGVQDYIAAATNSTASVRISEQNPGLRFKTTVNTGDLNMLIDKVGVENVKVGTLIAPTDKVGAKALTHAFGEAGVDYLDVVADVTDPFGTDGYKTVFAGSIANIKTANLNRDFTAVGYVAYFDGEAWNYSYSSTAAEKNVSDVAYAAYTDIAFEEAAGYTNEIVGEGDTLKGAYSPYTEVQRAVLKALIVEINIEDNFGGDIFAD